MENTQYESSYLILYIVLLCNFHSSKLYDLHEKRYKDGTLERGTDMKAIVFRELKANRKGLLYGWPECCSWWRLEPQNTEPL